MPGDNFLGVPFCFELFFLVLYRLARLFGGMGELL